MGNMEQRPKALEGWKRVEQLKVLESASARNRVGSIDFLNRPGTQTQFKSS
jgi:hypothetical protein